MAGRIAFGGAALLRDRDVDTFSKNLTSERPFRVLRERADIDARSRQPVETGWWAMDKVRFATSLDRVARVFAKVGWHRVNHLGRFLLKRLLGGDLFVEYDGFRIRGSVEHRGFLSGLREGSYEPFMTNLFKSAIRPGMVVLDIGAYLGQYTLLAARLVGSGGRVFAFEPDPLSYRFLVKNIQGNGFSDRVTPVSRAVSDRTGTYPFFSFDPDPSQSSLLFAQDGVRRTVVDCVALDEFLDERLVVDVIKMDIEGAEILALSGMERTIAHGSRGLTMFVEYSPGRQRAAGSSGAALIDRLEGFGFSVLLINEAERRLSPIDSSLESVEWGNLYCVRREERS